MKREPPEFMSFTTSGRVALRTSKAILVTVWSRFESLRVIQVLSITLTTLKQLEYSGAYWIEPDRLPQNVAVMIRDFDEKHLRSALDKLAVEDQLFSPNASRKIQ